MHPRTRICDMRWGDSVDSFLTIYGEPVESQTEEPGIHSMACEAGEGWSPRQQRIRPVLSVLRLAHNVLENLNWPSMIPQGTGCYFKNSFVNLRN